MVEGWEDSENVVKRHYEEKGYMVLNQNDKGFPDLIVLKDGKVNFFVEVKARQKPEIKRNEMQYHQYLNELGFDVKCINVHDKEPECFKPDPEWAEVIKKTNPWLVKNR